MPKKPAVLCVDDQAPNLRIRIMLLEQFGCTAVPADGHHTALRAVAERDFDLVIIDYHLANGETGEELARDLRVMHPQLPLVMLTGDVSLPASAREVVDAVLIKGASNPGALFELIERLVPDAALVPRKTMLVGNPSKKAG